MDILDRDSLVSLARPSGWPSVSVYMPMHRMPLETDQDRIRLKNLLRRAVEILAEQGVRQSDAEALCAPLNEALNANEFWRAGAHGLAAFVSQDFVQIIRTAEDMPEHITVGDRFYLRPLARALRAEGRFYALAIDKNSTRLYRADHTAFEQVDLGDTPTTYDEAMKWDESPQKQLGHRTVDPGRPSSRGNQHGGSVYSGHGGEGDANDEKTERFARVIERGVARALTNEQAPLMLLGIERLLAAYRAVNTYGNLKAEQVTGAMDFKSDVEIEEMAREAMKPHFDAAMEAELRELAEQEGSTLTSHDPAEIVAAAAAGRVRTLFFDDAMGPFGTFDRDRMEVEQVCSASPRLLRETGEPGAGTSDECGWDLVDLAAAETALHGGEVIGFSGEHAPVKGVAALYRY